MDRPGQVTGFSIVLQRADKAAPTDQVRTAIENLAKGLSAMPVAEHVNSLAEIRAARVMAWVTSAIALMVGATGVLNTMFMSVHERTSEIGILRAIGWRKWRVLWMVLAESLILSQMGAIAGSLIAIGLVKLLTRLPLTNGVIDGHVPFVVVAEGFLIALMVGLIGGLGAAWIAARMLPTAALRHD
jgi:putative ABC transport system permease protein